MKKSYFFLCLLFATYLPGAISNNILVSNFSLTGQNTTDDYVMVQFDLSWENSWRTSSAPSNWDAAWIFVKYRITAANGGDDLWKHAWLHNTGHSSGTGTGATIDPGLLDLNTAYNATTNPALGVFIYRSNNGTGTFSITGAQLRWNYGANNVPDNILVDVHVFAIELVYVPQGEFYVGSGGTESGRFKDGTTNNPFLINSEGALEIGNEDGKLWGSSTSGNNTIGGTGTLAASFPKGFAAFYMQKYEITQQQYVDFLNTLTQTQANSRKHTSSSSRYAITGNTVGSYATTNPYLACNFLSWMDGAAYSDWAGLRPMTELEFEKACRGTMVPVANEYAWGTATVAGLAYTLSNAGEANEGIATNYSTTAGNASYLTTDGSINGVLRVGIFAAHVSNTGRMTSGASYYGIMELSGNLWERPVTVGNATGRDFTGVHGDGALSDNGHANQTAWPGLSSSGEVTGATGSGFRGGSRISDAARMHASGRNFAADTLALRNTNYGFRGVRSQPFVCENYPVTDIDGNVYNTVQIGNQCWMKENLKVTKNPAGTPIERVCPEDNGTRCAEYGGLYTYNVMMNGASPSASNPSGVQGICPDGWHIPSASEWDVLINSVGGSTGAATKLRSTRTIPDPHPRWQSTTVSTDEFGFRALPAGFRNDQNQNVNMENWTMWWSTTEHSSPTATIAPDIIFSVADFSILNAVPKTSSPTDWAISIRCVKD